MNAINLPENTLALVEQLFGPEMIKAHDNLRRLTDALNALTDEQLNNAAERVSLA